MLRPTLARLPLTRAAAFSTSTARPLAKVTLVGRLGAAPEAATTSTGQEIVRYSLATNSGPTDNRVTSWWRVGCFAEGGLRERVLGAQKGTLVYVEGEARMREIERDGGKTESALSIVQMPIGKFEILSRPKVDGAED